ncbi:isoprenylcysteine carboxylmethyltransferase family protein [Nocardioides sp.]|uniref:methyltransferase family protein n=1 Tax=Nocardioides sp. TaxID=35761 RepID=UPI00286E8EE9|nr:isoprenylcysteine carboxylmethyltransferase family protein [Nocardioides sp.]
MGENPARIDLGRVVAVTLFAIMLSVNAVRLAGTHPLSHPLSAITTVLTMAFYVLLIWAYLRRSPSTRTDLRWSSWLVAFLGTGAPFAIPLVSRDGFREGGSLAGIAAVVLCLGLAAMLWALGALGTNISVVPQAREVISHGPYSLVRHPLYAAELLNVVGLCLATTGPGPWVVAGALVVFQVLRARREEALLLNELPGYAAYKERTPMLVPAFGRS